MKYERLTRKNANGLEIDWNLVYMRQSAVGIATDAYRIVINRLAELEDKIERGELVDVKENHLIPVSRANGKSSKQLETIDILTKYENGTLVDTKVKIGQRVYMRGFWKDDFDEYIVSNIIMENGELKYRLKHDFDEGKTCYSVTVFTLKEFEEEVFLTKAEAEQKLADELKELEK
jgi:hypothetical protein